MSAKNCVTHHHACDCREAKFAEMEARIAELEAAKCETNGIGQRAPCGEFIKTPCGEATFACTNCDHITRATDGGDDE